AQVMQSSYGKHRVTNPAEAVIPIALGADPFWQGRGGGGDHGSGPFENKTFQGQHRAKGLRIRTAFRTDLAHPAFPPVSGLSELTVQVVRRAQMFRDRFVQSFR